MYFIPSLQRIEQVKSTNKGSLYGLTQNNATIVLGLSFSTSIENNLPVGFKELGSIEWTSNSGDSTLSQTNVNCSILSVVSASSKVSQFQNATIVHFQYNLNSEALNVFIRGKSKEFEQSSFDVIKDNQLFGEWVYLLTKFSLRYSVSNGSDYANQLLNELKATRTKLCETNKPTFKIVGTEIILKKDKGLVGIGKNAKVNAAVLQTKKDQQEKDIDLKKYEVLNVTLESNEDNCDVDDVSSLFGSKSI